MCIQPSTPRSGRFRIRRPLGLLTGLVLIKASGAAPRLGKPAASTRKLANQLQSALLGTIGLSGPPQAIAASPDEKNAYTVTPDSLITLSTDESGALTQVQDLKNGVQDVYGHTVEYFNGLSAVAISPDGQNVYVAGTSVMPAIGGITVLLRNGQNGQLSILQQFRIDQRAGIQDLDGLVGSLAIALSPDGRWVYVVSGGYYRDHNLLVFSRDASAQGRLSLVQNINIYDTSAGRVLPSAVVVAPDGSNVYVIGQNLAISTSAILAYRVNPGDGHLTEIQEVGPLRSTLLLSASMDPSGRAAYISASYGSNLVWIFQRATDGTLTVVNDPVVESEGQAFTAPRGSAAAPLAVDTPYGNLLFVAVEEDDAVYQAYRENGLGRLSYVDSRAIGQIPAKTVIRQARESSLLHRPKALTYLPRKSILYVAEGGSNSIAAFKLWAA